MKQGRFYEGQCAAYAEFQLSTSHRNMSQVRCLHNWIFRKILAFAGAFVHRHCRELGLPESFAIPAAHLALCRPFDSCNKSFYREGNLLPTLSSRSELLQKAPVFLAIAEVSKVMLLELQKKMDAEVGITISWLQLLALQTEHS
jgi:hypothetical protein